MEQGNQTKNNKIQEKTSQPEEKKYIENDNEKEIPKYEEFINLSYEEFGVNCISYISKIFSNNLYICSLKIYSKEKFNVEIIVKKKII